MSFTTKATGGFLPPAIPPFDGDAISLGTTTAATVVQHQLGGEVVEGPIPQLTPQRVLQPFPSLTLPTQPVVISLGEAARPSSPPLPPSRALSPRKSLETIEDDSHRTSDTEESFTESETQGTDETSESESREQILRFSKKARKPESKSRDWTLIAGIVIFVVGLVLVGFVALCIAGIFPIDFLGKIGCACSVVGGCIVMTIGGCIAYYRWQLPKSDKS